MEFRLQSLKNASEQTGIRVPSSPRLQEPLPKNDKPRSAKCCLLVRLAVKDQLQTMQENIEVSEEISRYRAAALCAAA
jgi:hypothetical protein